MSHLWYDAERDIKHGFTGHRHDDELGLIDMRGRIYDSALRRFLTPDPFVSSPLLGQSYNRFSYVLNNPVESRSRPSSGTWTSFWLARWRRQSG